MTIMDKASLSFALGLVRYEVELIANKYRLFVYCKQNLIYAVGRTALCSTT